MSGSGDRGDELLDRAYGVGAQAMAAPPAAPANRRGAILALGIIMIVLGSLLALPALFTAITGGVSGKAPVIFIGLVYGIPSLNLLLTGIGSIRFASWARRATILSAAVWLGIALLCLGGMLIGVSRGFVFGKGELAMISVIMIPLFVFWLALPIVLIAVYTRPSVRATFELGRGHLG